MLKAAPRLNQVCDIITNHHENVDGFRPLWIDWKKVIT